MVDFNIYCPVRQVHLKDSLQSPVALKYFQSIVTTFKKFSSMQYFPLGRVSDL